MKIIVGLGNPDSKYDNSRHNAGSICLDEISRNTGIKFSEKKSLALIGTGYINSETVILVKSRSYMNNSGDTIKYLRDRFGIQVSDLLIIYDDMDLPLGKIRIRTSGTHGGHKGIESIIYQLESEDFQRLKLGIALEDINMKPSEKYVLTPFPKKYHEDVDFMIIKAADSIDFYLNNTIEETMNKYNRIIEGEKNNE